MEFGPSSFWLSLGAPSDTPQKIGNVQVQRSIIIFSLKLYSKPLQWWGLSYNIIYIYIVYKLNYLTIYIDTVYTYCANTILHEPKCDACQQCNISRTHDHVQYSWMTTKQDKPLQVGAPPVIFVDL